MMQYRNRIVHAWLSAKQQFAALVSERDALKIENETLKRQFDWTLHEVGELTAQLRELRAAALARAGAHDELARLHREAAIQRAERAERNPIERLQ